MTAPAQPVSDAATPAGTAPKKVSGLLGFKLAGSVSSAVSPVTSPAVSRPQQPDRILTQQELDQYWNQFLSGHDEEMAGARDLLKDYRPEIDATGCFTLKMPNSFVEAEFSKYKVSLLKLLRSMSGSRSLNVKVEVVHVEMKASAYRPDEKYEAMLERNPELAKLRDLFPAIDY